jgi:hypothetical protein
MTFDAGGSLWHLVAPDDGGLTTETCTGNIGTDI